MVFSIWITHSIDAVTDASRVNDFHLIRFSAVLVKTDNPLYGQNNTVRSALSPRRVRMCHSCCKQWNEPEILFLTESMRIITLSFFPSILSCGWSRHSPCALYLSLSTRLLKYDKSICLSAWVLSFGVKSVSERSITNTFHCFFCRIEIVSKYSFERPADSPAAQQTSIVPNNELCIKSNWMFHSDPFVNRFSNQGLLIVRMGMPISDNRKKMLTLIALD